MRIRNVRWEYWCKMPGQKLQQLQGVTRTHCVVKEVTVTCFLELAHNVLSSMLCTNHAGFD